MRSSEAASRAGLPRASAHRILRTLVAEDAVAFDARTRRHTLGLGLFVLAARVRRDGYCGGASGLIPGMAGMGAPIRGADGRAVGAISIGTTVDRLNPERREVIAMMLVREADAIGVRINPFDRTLRRAGAALTDSTG